MAPCIPVYRNMGVTSATGAEALKKSPQERHQFRVFNKSFKKLVDQDVTIPG